MSDMTDDMDIFDDYWDNDSWLDLDDLENMGFSSILGYATCKRCRCTTLHWGKINDKWKLLTKTGKVHSCGKFDLTKNKVSVDCIIKRFQQLKQAQGH